MYFRRLFAFVLAGLIIVADSGCGPITAGTIIQKGGMWLAKEAAKKTYEELREQHERDAQEDDEDYRPRARESTREKHE